MVAVTLSTLFLLMISFTALSKLTSDAPVAIPRNSITTLLSPTQHPSPRSSPHRFCFQSCSSLLMTVPPIQKSILHPDARAVSKTQLCECQPPASQVLIFLPAGRVPQNLTLPSFPAWSSSLFQVLPGIGVPRTWTSSSVSQNHQFLPFIQYSDFSLKCQTSPPS